MKVLISGGGTGGHIFPAIAIANAIKFRNPDIEILFVGANGKMEMKKVPEAGYNIVGLPIRGLQRKLSWQIFIWPFQLLFSLGLAVKIVMKFKPDVAVGVGGYASGPVLRVASWFGIPIVIQEQNSFPGVTNRMLSKSASKICVAFEGMDRYFSKEKLVLTGNPVRQDFTHLPSQQQALEFFDLDPNRKTICVFGGSLGARSLNDAVLHIMERFSKHDQWQMIWQYGSLYESIINTPEFNLPNNVKAFPFIGRMDLAYAAADLVIARAGALTLSELMVTSKPNILIPSPNVAEDHQRKNAEYLVRQHAALMILDQHIKENLWQGIVQMMNDVDERRTQSQQLKALAKPDAAHVIAEIILQTAGK